MTALWKALLISVLLSAGLSVLAWGLVGSGYPVAAQLLVWPATLLMSFVPHPNLGTEAHPLYEGTPVDVVAAYAGLFAQVLIYWISIYALLRAKEHK